MSNLVKTYKILGKTNLIEYVTYTVDAESEEEAIQLVEDGEVDDNGDHWAEETGGGTTYEISE